MQIIPAKKLLGNATAVIGNTFIKFLTLILGALTLMTTLAWNEACKAQINKHEEFKEYGLWVYAIFVTLLTLFVGYFAHRFASEED